MSFLSLWGGIGRDVSTQARTWFSRGRENSCHKVNVVQRIAIVSGINFKSLIDLTYVFHVEFGIQYELIQEFEKVIFCDISLALLVNRIKNLNEVQIFHTRWKSLYRFQVTLLNDINDWLCLSVDNLFEISFHDLLFDYHNLSVKS